MAKTVRDSEAAMRRQAVRAQTAERKAADLEHALNLLLNDSLIKFHASLGPEGAVHEFFFGTARNVPAPAIVPWLGLAGVSENRKIILWKTTFMQGNVYASAYHETEFRSLPKHLEEGSELRALLKAAIAETHLGAPYLVESPASNPS